MVKSSRDIQDPVFRLLRPLYGWSRSGNLWEEHLKESLQTMLTQEDREALNIESINLQAVETHHETIRRLKQNGWTPVEGWPQTFMKIGSAGFPLILTVYVDDMVMLGKGHRAEWPKIRKIIKTSEPVPIDRMRGVNFTTTKVDENQIHIRMDMDIYAQQTVDAYNAVPGAPKLKPKVTTPWLEPSREELIQVSNDTSLCVFSKCAASLLMKALYMARMVRADIVFTINHLAKYVSKWNPLCDKQLTHLFSYIANTPTTALHMVIDKRDICDPTSLEVHGYPDADLCGSFDTTKSTSGGFLCLVGKHGTFVQLEWHSKRQAATSHSTSEAEMVSMSKLLRESMVPQMGLWANLLKRDIKGKVFEDNMSTIVIAKAGYSQQLRHIAKHHRISLGLVHELISHPDLELLHVETNKQKGDLFTKGLDKGKHEEAMRMINMFIAMGMCVFLNPS